jgi:DNA polymerase III alpha subunit
MDNTRVHSHSTQLKGRTLWFDGDSSFEAANLVNAIKHHNIVYVDELSPMVVEYNKNFPKADVLKLKMACAPLRFDWNIPPDYKDINIIDYIFDKHDVLTTDMTPTEVAAREHRITSELLAFKNRNLLDIIPTLIYIINTLTINNVVWGVGRGSSVSSYVLYTIGVHDVDSFEYELDIGDFLHD